MSHHTLTSCKLHWFKKKKKDLHAFRNIPRALCTWVSGKVPLSPEEVWIQDGCTQDGGMSGEVGSQISFRFQSTRQHQPMPWDIKQQLGSILHLPNEMCRKTISKYSTFYFPHCTVIGRWPPLLTHRHMFVCFPSLIHIYPGCFP